MVVASLTECGVAADSRFRQDAQRFGWRRALVGHGFGFLRRRFGVHVCHVRGRALGASPDADSIAPGITIRPLDAFALANAAAEPALGIDPEFAAQSLARGDIPFGAFDGERLVGYLFYATGCAPHVDGIWVRVDPDCRYGYKGYTRPDYRGRRINVALSLASEQHFIERGITRHLGFVDASNLASIATGAPKGNTVYGYAGYLQWFGRILPFRTAGARRVGFGFYPGAPTQPPAD
jgi:GNAT superfamily N-acetyltransferase